MFQPLQRWNHVRFQIRRLIFDEDSDASRRHWSPTSKPCVDG
jgi:hypothetical protein